MQDAAFALVTDLLGKNAVWSGTIFFEIEIVLTLVFEVKVRCLVDGDNGESVKFIPVNIFFSFDLVWYIEYGILGICFRKRKESCLVQYVLYGNRIYSAIIEIK